jgi:hypothetical protein
VALDGGMDVGCQDSRMLSGSKLLTYRSEDRGLDGAEIN